MPFCNMPAPARATDLPSAPKQISLAFTAALNPALSGVEVTDAAGRDVEAAAPGVDGSSMQVALKPLAAGTYHVAWHAVSVDAHRTEGAYSFTIKP